MLKGFIQKDDNKSLNWKESCAPEVELIPLAGSQILSPLQLLLHMIKNKKTPDFFVFRYLNDYPSALRTILRLISEISVIVFCFIFRIRVFWVCHNVDKESIVNYKFITRIRRWLIIKASDNIFVTSQLLLPFAKRILGTTKVCAISFGQVNIEKKMDLEAKNTLLKHQLFNQEGVVRVIITGSPAEKSLHFDYVIKLIEAFEGIGKSIVIVVAGEFDNSLRSIKLLGSYRENKAIILFERYTCFSLEFIKNNFDFYFRVYSDYSVPYTVYESSSLRIPVLTMNKGFLPTLINQYNLGYVLNKEFTNLVCAIESCKAIDEKQYQSFLYDHHWGTLGDQLIRNCK